MFIHGGTVRVVFFECVGVRKTLLSHLLYGAFGPSSNTAHITDLVFQHHPANSFTCRTDLTVSVLGEKQKASEPLFSHWQILSLDHREWGVKQLCLTDGSQCASGNTLYKKV